MVAQNPCKVQVKFRIPVGPLYYAAQSESSDRTGLKIPEAQGSTEGQHENIMDQ